MNSRNAALGAIITALAVLPLAASAESGFFFAASVGSSTFEDDIDGLVIDTDTTAYRLTGGFQVGDYFGLEAGYHSFGKYDEQFDVGGAVTNVELRADGYTLGLMGGVPLSETFSLFGRGGAFFWDAEARIDDIIVAFPDDTDWYYGAGADFKVNPRFSLIGDWTRYEFESSESDVISIGFKYVF
jgi:OOP family OmpA-OmpF porin